MPNSFTTTTATGNTPADPETLAMTPKSVMNDEGSITERDVSELIEAKTFNAANNTSSKAPYGIRVARTPRGGL